MASFFVSRVDTQVDKALEAKDTREALALRGKIAVANAKLVYRRFREIFHGDAFSAKRRRGARVQRPLWASTSTKNPNYRDVLYVEELIGLFGQFLADGVVDELFLTLSPQVAGRMPERFRPALVMDAQFLPGKAPWLNLLSVKRAGDHLYLRYRVPAGTEV